MTSSVARQTLDAARFFSRQAATYPAGDRAFRYNLEASIVFGRSITFHLQKEFSEHSEFLSWYDQWRERMGKNMACSFFLNKRNFVLKEGRVNFNYIMPLEPGAFVSSFGELTIKVIRGKPWYRRPLWQLREDGRRSWSQLIRRVNKSRKRKQKVPQPTAVDNRKPGAGFVDFRPNEDAIVVLNEYLDYLDEIVSDAEIMFRKDAV